MIFSSIRMLLTGVPYLPMTGSTRANTNIPAQSPALPLLITMLFLTTAVLQFVKEIPFWSQSLMKLPSIVTSHVPTSIPFADILEQR